MVDVGLLASSSENLTKYCITNLKSEFKITVKPANYFLGLEVDNKDDSTFYISQQAYTKKILQRLDMSKYKPVSANNQRL